MIGNISHGTLRTQDLIPAFLDTLAELAPAHHAALCAQPFGPVPSYALEDEDADWWHSEDASYLLEELTDLLSEHAPEFCFFGASEGMTPQIYVACLSSYNNADCPRTRKPWRCIPCLPGMLR